MRHQADPSEALEIVRGMLAFGVENGLDQNLVAALIVDELRRAGLLLPEIVYVSRSLVGCGTGDQRSTERV